MCKVCNMFTGYKECIYCTKYTVSKLCTAYKVHYYAEDPKYASCRDCVQSAKSATLRAGDPKCILCTKYKLCATMQVVGIVYKIQGVSKKRYFLGFLSFFSSRGRILLFRMCFGIRISSPVHLATQTRHF